MVDQITPEMVNAILFDIGTHDPCDEEMEETICRNILRAALAAGWLPPPTEDEPERVARALCAAVGMDPDEAWSLWEKEARAAIAAIRGEKK